MNDRLLRTGLHQDRRPQPASLAWRFLSTQKAGDDGAGARESMCEELLQQALGKSELGDVRFHVDGAWVASGHRSVLSARSGVLVRMFANETEERRSGVVKMDDVTAEGLVAFLEFVYLGTAAASVLVAGSHDMHVDVELQKMITSKKKNRAIRLCVCVRGCVYACFTECACNGVCVCDCACVALSLFFFLSLFDIFTCFTTETSIHMYTCTHSELVLLLLTGFSGRKRSLVFPCKDCTKHKAQTCRQHALLGGLDFALKGHT